MKIIVFEDGAPGRWDSILGENVQAELEELLGGPIVWEELTSRLHLVARLDPQQAEASYGIYRSGRVVGGVWGNAVVVRVDIDGAARDVSPDDAETARFLVRPLDPAGY